jgi:hypothetical protein
MKRNRLLLFAFPLFFALINILNAADNIQEFTLKSMKYKGLTIYIQKASYARIKRLYRTFESYYRAKKIELIEPENILKNIETRFSEMANQNKNNLPICLEKALECDFERIKNGEEKLVIEWRFNIDVKYIDSYEKFYKQKDGADGAWDPPRQSKRIVVYNAFEKLCGASLQKERKIVYSKNILTSSIIFHELLHLIRWKYHPKCLKTFQDVDDTLEEAIAEDGTWLVFGKTYTLQYYEKILGYPHCNGCDISQNDCTKKNVCSSPCCDDCEDFK